MKFSLNFGGFHFGFNVFGLILILILKRLEKQSRSTRNYGKLLSMTNKLSFSKMSLFQLMNWLEENNYNEETYLPIVDEIDDMGYNPFQDMPDNYEGTLEDWEKSLDEVESYLKSVYIRACSTVLEYKNASSV